MVKPGEKGLLCVRCSPGGAERERLVRHLVVPRVSIVRVQKKVGMTFDQSGSQSIVRQIDYSGVVGGVTSVGSARFRMWSP